MKTHNITQKVSYKIKQNTLEQSKSWMMTSYIRQSVHVLSINTYLLLGRDPNWIYVLCPKENLGSAHINLSEKSHASFLYILKFLRGRALLPLYRGTEFKG